MFYILLNNFQLFQFSHSPFSHMVHLSYLFPLSFLINIFKCFCHENSCCKGRKHSISLEEAIAIKISYLWRALKKPLYQMAKIRILKANLMFWFENRIILNDSKWGVQISIINVDYLSSGEEAGISTCTGGTTSVTDKDLCFRLVYFFHSVSL